jgi:hypothetical protein
MAILLEAINIVIKRESAEKKYSGGILTLFMDLARFDLPSHMDFELIRIGFMDPDTLHNFVPVLLERRVDFTEDWCIVDMMSGPTKPCSWLGFGRQMFFKNGSNIGISFEPYSIGWLKSKSHFGIICNQSNEFRLAIPKNWNFSNAVTNMFNVPGEKTKEILIKLGLPNGMVPFVDEFNNHVTNPKPNIIQLNR